jgi:drug/metabolite transporter (DMT)-like permease
MPRKEQMDAFGAASLVVFAVVFGFNQVVIKVVNDGLQPVFAAGLRSLGAMPLLLFWMRLRGVAVTTPRGAIPSGLFLASLFTMEFLLVYTALDLTTVSRMSVIFYSMPIWLALGAHFLIPGDAMTRRKALGLALAFAGVSWAILDRPADGSAASLAGDLAALGAAMCWAGIGLTIRAAPIRAASPEVQLLWQLGVSAAVLIAVAPLFGPLLREPTALHAAGMAYQIVVVAFAAFVFWLWVMTVYPASSVAAFSFLTPVFGVFFGWLLLGERIGVSILGALALVAAGLWLINRPHRRRRQVLPPPDPGPRRDPRA